MPDRLTGGGALDRNALEPRPAAQLTRRPAWGKHGMVKPYGSVKTILHEHMILPARTAQGGGGSFKDRKPIGEVRCCESWMAEQIH